MIQNEVMLTISIVNWNTSEMIVECIRSAFSTIKKYSFTIIVVDNNSSDDSVKEIQKYFPEVQIVRNRKNIGYACAHNQVLHTLKSHYVLMLNPDCVLYDNTIDDILDFMENTPEVGMASALVVSSKNDFFVTVRSLPKMKGELLRMMKDYCYPFGKIIAPSRQDLMRQNRMMDADVVFVEESIAGPFLLLRHKMLDDIGLLEEKFFLFSEENDLCLRAWQHGWQRVFFPGKKVLHLLGGARKRAPSGFSRYHQSRSKLLFFEKHYGVSSMYLLAFIYFFFASYSVLVCLLKKFPFLPFDQQLNNEFFISSKSILKALVSAVFGKQFTFPSTD